MPPRPYSAPRRRSHDGWSFVRIAVVGVIAIGAAGFIVSHPPTDLMASAPAARDSAAGATRVTTLPGAFGMSGEVRLQLRLPGEIFDFPLQVAGPEDQVEYQWITADDSLPVSPLSPLRGTAVSAPGRPGFYRLAVSQADGNRVVDSVVVGVLVPFAAKRGSSLNGYQMGRYRAENAPGQSSPPRGFVEVLAKDAELPVSRHFRLADFLTHDGQDKWPRYVALDPRILDKVELVLRYLGSRERDITMDVHSGFRTPLYNRRVPRAASDSRHQYGDAADLAIDADGDGRVTYLDGLAVAHAVDMVERDHPDLAGGLGVYGNRGTGAYVHIDVRGERKRWRG